MVNSDIEAERDHLRVGDHIVRVLTMKEAIAETRPLVLDALLRIQANFYVVTEWTPLLADKARKEVNKRRRHFNMSKTGFVSQVGNDASTTSIATQFPLAMRLREIANNASGPSLDSSPGLGSIQCDTMS